MSEKGQEYLEQRIDLVRQQMSKQADMITKLQDFQKDSLKFQDRTRENLDKTNKRIESAGLQYHEELLKASDTLTTQLKALEKSMIDQIREANNNLQK